MATIIDGKAIAARIREELKVEVEAIKAQGAAPGLAVVLVGEDPASQVYVRNKQKACEEIGMVSFGHFLPAETSEPELLALVDTLNADPRVHGILVQLPLPKHIAEKNIVNAISPAKDVDGLHPANVGKLLIGEDTLVSCTPQGCQELLVRSGYDPSGKHVVIVGRSNLVGKPLAAILMQKARGANATVTVCHSGTKDIPLHTLQADILLTAMGNPGFIKADMVREGVVVIDVGTTRVEDATKKSGYRLAGDVEFDGVAAKAAAITPVPGGVGPMTITMLLKNTLKAYRALTRVS
ncbi:MAG: bifunctional methylenetetrahydrofolate dehydrogenase/methenyltetrahydrofolate cyclohydrolase FolD [FCB group bacterium]|jgi:methylenetetrahydrofolate dehydrogenase (NADP+)/methenyltetrahydrofolate cyclohydrolase|nr:bifunctional methylenetetrahydrofolate dehydrogenase/methenyltetrahydrofolate cyclohydrolase FolD [FCB group bacterium]